VALNHPDSVLRFMNALHAPRKGDAGTDPAIYYTVHP